MRKLEREQTRRPRILTYDDLLREMQNHLDQSFSAASQARSGLLVVSQLKLAAKDRPSPATIFDSRPSDEGHWRLNIADGNSLELIITNAADETIRLTLPASISEIPDDRWTTIGAQFFSGLGRTTVELFVDGYYSAWLTFPAELSIPTRATITGLRIGARQDESAGLVGRLRSAVIFDEPLSFAARTRMIMEITPEMEGAETAFVLDGSSWFDIK